MRREKTMFSASEQFNGIPTYPEFLACFDDLLADNYKKLILTSPYGTVYSTVTGTGILYRSKGDIDDFGKVAEFVANSLKIEVTRIYNNTLADEEAVTQIKADEPRVEQSAAAAAGGGRSKARRTRRKQKKADSYTAEYKQLSMENGSNQVVYMPQYNISGISAHSAYCGVSFWGMLGNLGVTLEGQNAASPSRKGHATRRRSS